MTTSIGNYLKLIRENKGDSLRIMAQKLGISPAYLSSIENGKRSVPNDFSALIFKAYDLDDKQRQKIMDAIYESTDNYKVDLRCITKNKRKVLISMVEDDLDDSVVEELCRVIKEAKE